jgi:hypothetical protein
LVPRVFARGNDFESFPRSDIQMDRHVGFFGCPRKRGAGGGIRRVNLIHCTAENCHV